jgi:hypothetical protein
MTRGQYESLLLHSLGLSPVYSLPVFTGALSLNRTRHSRQHQCHLCVGKQPSLVRTSVKKLGIDNSICLLRIKMFTTSCFNSYAVLNMAVVNAILLSNYYLETIDEKDDDVHST